MNFVSIFLTLLFVSSLAGAASDCAHLKQELNALQAAQRQIINSLVNNHETFASSLEEYSTVVRSTPKSSSSVALEMSESASAFRQRGIQGRQTALKLNLATKDLIARVASCLK